MIENSDFAQVLPFWRDHLWLGRETVIEPVSAIGENGDIDMRWRSAQACFWKLKPDFQTEPAGVVSALFLSGHGARLRGLWVAPSFRVQGFGKILIEHVAVETRARDLPKLWTMARQTAVPFYTACEFKNPRVVTGYEFGPHVLLERFILP